MKLTGKAQGYDSCTNDNLNILTACSLNYQFTDRGDF